MAIRIFEMRDLGVYGAPVRLFPPAVRQTGTVGSESAKSAAFASGTVLVTVQADTACHVAFGADPVATRDDYRIGAGETADFGVKAGDKIAWIAD